MNEIIAAADTASPHGSMEEASTSTTSSACWTPSTTTAAACCSAWCFYQPRRCGILRLIPLPLASRRILPAAEAPTIRGPPPLSSQSLARDQRVTTTVWLWSAYGRAEAGTFASLGPTRRRMSENVVFELSTSTLSHPGACASLEAIFVRPPSWRLASDPALKGRIVFETWWRRGRIELPVQKKYVRDLLQA